MVTTKKKPKKKLSGSKRTRDNAVEQPAAESAKAAPRRPRQHQADRPKKLSALDAAATVLAETKAPMTTGEMIEMMAAKGLWASPNGRTPAATLYSAILKELKTKGDESRFVKTDRGRFAIKA
jgi:hypothetical protein